MGKREIRPFATPKPLNRSSRKVAYVITSWITHMQKFLRSLRGFFYARNCASKMFTRLFEFFFPGYFQWPTAKASEPIFTQNTSNDVVPRKDVRFGWLVNKHLTFSPLIPEKPPFLGPLLKGEIFRPKAALQWGCFL